MEKEILKQNWKEEERIQLALHFYDKQIIDKQELEEILGFDFKTGAFFNINILEYTLPVYRLGIFSQLYDKGVLDKKVLRKLLGYED